MNTETHLYIMDEDDGPKHHFAPVWQSIVKMCSYVTVNRDDRQTFSIGCT